MTITLNGQSRSVSDGLSLQALITQVTGHPEHVVAEVNGRIVEKTAWASFAIDTGATIELVTFVGGG
ncbi:MAG: sulfur carrier protein ThiS [Elusimicrobia bacterium]|nr:sulfur carrier protein ThiS [Elusimicrobiota bacterium]